MKYSSVQLVTKLVFTRTPWLPLGEALSDDGYEIEDDGATHLKISKGGVVARVPWTNVVGAFQIVVPGIPPMPLVVKADVDAPRGGVMLPPPMGGMALDRKIHPATKGPKK